MDAYRHVQDAAWAWIVAACVSGVLYVALHPFIALAYPLIALVIVVTAIFSRLTIQVDASGVRWWFGFGFPAGTLALGEIARASVTRTNLLEGFGIHWTIWHGWLWNVGGFQAVEFERGGGGRVTLGTDDPQGLSEAVERFRRGVP